VPIFRGFSIKKGRTPAVQHIRQEESSGEGKSKRLSSASGKSNHSADPHQSLRPYGNSFMIMKSAQRGRPGKSCSAGAPSLEDQLSVGFQVFPSGLHSKVRF